MQPQIRDAREQDIPAITSIYSHYVLTSPSTFEEVPPKESEMLDRYNESVLNKCPYVVAEAANTEIVGFASAKIYYGRSAFRFTLENSVYVAENYQGQGVGEQLLERLIIDSRKMGATQLVALIGGGIANSRSVHLHKKLGFYVVGNQEKVGYKNGKWEDILIMQKALNNQLHA